MAQTNYSVAFFTNTYLPFVSGVSHSIKLYSDHLKQNGVRVMIYAPEYSEETEDADDIRRITSISNFNNTEFSLPLPLSSKPTADSREEYFDLVHVHHPFLLGELGLQFSRQERIPLVFTYHTQYERYTHYVPINEDTAVRTILNHATDFCNMCDLVLAPTRDIKKQLRARGVTSKIVVLPSGVEIGKYAQAQPERAREKLGIPHNKPLLLYVGRLAQEKNMDFVFDAATKVLADNPAATFAVAGGGSHTEALKARVNGLSGDGGQVRFAGTVTGQDLIDLYSAADVFLFASKTETQGMVLVEAMAGGTPVVALDADAVRDVVKDQYNGRLLAGDASPDAFAEAIQEMLGNKSHREKCIDGARTTAAEFDMPKLTQQLLRQYRALKLKPRHELKHESMSFGLVRQYFNTVWQDLRDSLSQI
jgi:glycosyltransferase involved in cell wall biosynthesis